MCKIVEIIILHYFRREMGFLVTCRQIVNGGRIDSVRILHRNTWGFVKEARRQVMAGELCFGPRISDRNNPSGDLSPQQKEDEVCLEDQQSWFSVPDMC